MNEELAALRNEMRIGFARLDERVGRIDERVGHLDERVGRLDESVRHNGVLLEGLRDDIRQLADAHILLNQRVKRYREENEAAHTEILGLLRSSHRQLDRRVTRLEERRPES